MFTTLYASALALLMCWLSLKVIGVRRKYRVAYADGGVEELKKVRSAQSNAVDYIPIALLLLFFLEYNGGFSILIHAFGLVLVAGRLIHCRGILSENLKSRVLGMQITLGTIICLAVLNIGYVLFGNVIYW